MGIHESQSRFYENMIGRSKGFWEYFFPTVVKEFPIFLVPDLKTCTRQ